VIESGTGDVVRSGERIAQLGAGDYFGEMALMGDGRRVTDVIATSPMVVFAMFGTAFREMEAAFPEIASKVHATLEERLPAS
jgi:CRP-like cAMP-binding protein